MANDFVLLGALVASRNLTYDDAAQIAEFVDHVETLDLDVPDLTAAIDLALGYFNDAPEVEAAKQAEAVQAAHDAETCPDCGGDMMDADDFDQAVSVWAAIRGIVDKYNYDMFAGHDGEAEEC